jgi:hypothetical protein
MLHRGKYTRKGEKEVMRDKLTWRNVFTKLMGINAEYTRGDRILAWSVFIYSFGWGFGSFLVIVVWNTFSSWPDNWWAHWFMIQNLIVPGIVAVVSTVWFTIGGTIDLRRLFQRLEAKEIDILDDGRVIGHVSADDVSLVEHVDHVRLEEAHIEERKLEQALEEEHDEEDLDDLRDKMRDDEK